MPVENEERRVISDIICHLIGQEYLFLTLGAEPLSNEMKQHIAAWARVEIRSQEYYKALRLAFLYWIRQRDQRGHPRLEIERQLANKVTQMRLPQLPYPLTPEIEKAILSIVPFDTMHSFEMIVDGKITQDISPVTKVAVVVAFFLLLGLVLWLLDKIL